MFLASPDEDLRKLISDEAAKLVPKKKPRKKRAYRPNRKSQPSIAAKQEADFFAGMYELPVNLPALYEVIGPYKLKRLVSDTSDVYADADQKVRCFVDQYTRLNESWISAERLQRINNHMFTLNLTRAYLLIYLPHFYIMERSNLDEYPTSFNEFVCPYYVTMSENLGKATNLKGTRPKSLIEFINEYSDYHKWSNESLYQRIIKLDHFFDYVVENAPLISNAEKFKNTIGTSNYPRVAKRNATVKKTIHSEYFSTLISFLYSLEYLVEHINSMSFGETPGILNKELYYLTADELETSFVWSKLWGTTGAFTRLENMPLEQLSYTPIFFHDEKVYPITECKRFYSTTGYECNGTRKSILAPHHIRVFLLMCETGIRQHHLKWLDLSEFDSAVDDTQAHAMQPLSVNTDKSHGAWTAAVSCRVIELCRKQREWYLGNTTDSFTEDLWYGGKKNSKFGRYKPLFRISEKEVPSDVHKLWPFVLISFQKMIRTHINNKSPDFVRFVKVKGVYECDGVSITEENEFKIPKGYDLKARTTPHGLRATFITEKIRFLPASFIGEHFTGQTESLVNYYNVFDNEGFKSHEQLLIDRLSKDLENTSNGVAPELAELAALINSNIHEDIKEDPAAAILKHGLISLSGVDDDKTGIEVLKAKKFTKLAFNDTHICPFNNYCPTEVIKDYGVNRPCNLCPYALRGCHHLPAISAAKDRSFELAKSIKEKINEYKRLSKAQKSQVVIDQLTEECDRALNDAFSLELAERKLYEMHKRGMTDSYIASEPEAIKIHYKKVEVTGADHLLKRLVDIQSFPSLDSPRVQAKFAFTRKKLLLMDGDFKGLFSPNTEPESNLLISKIKEMMSVHNLSAEDIFTLAKKDFGEIISAIKPAIATKNMVFALENQK